MTRYLSDSASAYSKQIADLTDASAVLDAMKASGRDADALAWFTTGEKLSELDEVSRAESCYISGMKSGMHQGWKMDGGTSDLGIGLCLVRILTTRVTSNVCHNSFMATVLAYLLLTKSLDKDGKPGIRMARADLLRYHKTQFVIKRLIMSCCDYTKDALLMIHADLYAAGQCVGKSEREIMKLSDGLTVETGAWRDFDFGGIKASQLAAAGEAVHSDLIKELSSFFLSGNPFYTYQYACDLVI